MSRAGAWCRPWRRSGGDRVAGGGSSDRPRQALAPRGPDRWTAELLAVGVRDGERPVTPGGRGGRVLAWPRLGAVMPAWAQAGLAAGQASDAARHTRRSACRVRPGPCQPRLVRNSAIATYWHAAAAQTKA